MEASAQALKRHNRACIVVPIARRLSELYMTILLDNFREKKISNSLYIKLIDFPLNFQREIA